MDKPKKYEDRLMDVLGFDEDDLAVNQAGNITASQLEALRNGYHKWAARLLLVLVIALAYLFIFVLPAVASPDASIVGTCFSSLFAGVFGIVLTIGCWRKAGGYGRDLYERRLEIAEGRVQLSMKSAGRSAQYVLEVGDQRFQVSQKALLTFKNGDPYRIYYAPCSKRILSAEWLRGDDNLLSA